jgi:DNA repair protein RadC
MIVSDIKLAYTPKLKPNERQKCASSRQLYEAFSSKYEKDTIYYKETFKAIYLDSRLGIIGITTISEGGMSGCVVDVRIIAQAALLSHASFVAVCHNHPGGSVEPSRQDDSLTEKIKNALELLDIKLIDHLIITDCCYYSYADERRIF